CGSRVHPFKRGRFNSRPEFRRHHFRQRVRATALHRRRSQRADDHRGNRIEQRLCAKCGYRQCDLATDRSWHAISDDRAVLEYFSARHYRHTGRGSCLSIALFRCSNHAGWDSAETLYLFLKRRFRNNQPRLAHRCGCRSLLPRHGFSSTIQHQRAGLGLFNGIVYVPYSGHWGDCGTYHGWVVGIPVNNPAGLTAWATSAIGGGIWGHSGAASDGTNLFVTTGNTFNTLGVWGGGESITRLQAGPVWSGLTSDYWAPANWLTFDDQDKDLGSSGPVLVDVPGATPSQLVVAMGKSGDAYVVDRNNLGGITAPVATAHVANDRIINAVVTYPTAQGPNVVFHSDGSLLGAFGITATNPPAIATRWNVTLSGRGSPFVTSTDGTNNMIVWVAGTEP